MTQIPDGADPEITDLVRAVYPDDESVATWYTSQNARFGGERPLDLLARGEREPVLAEAQRLASLAMTDEEQP